MLATICHDIELFRKHSEPASSTDSISAVSANIYEEILGGKKMHEHEDFDWLL